MGRGTLGTDPLRQAMLRSPQEMDRALEEERYGEAATLRDQGGVGLMGWWAGRGEDDAVGHVVRITPEFGRYVAQAFTARDLADSTVSAAARPPASVLARAASLRGLLASWLASWLALGGLFLPQWPLGWVGAYAWGV
jgi:hypothetical protein